MADFDASVYLPDATCKFLFINGNKDKVFNIVPYDKTYRLVPKGHRTIILKPNMSHSHPSGWASQEIQCFFDNVLNDKDPLPQIVIQRRSRRYIKVTYNSVTNLLSAEFYYSTDTISTNENRIWKSTEAIINTAQKAITCHLPETFKYGFLYIKDPKGNAVSSELIIN